MDGLKQGGLIQGIIRLDKGSFILIEIGQEFRTLVRWSWMLLRGNNNVQTRTVTSYCPTVSASGEGSYSKQLESLTIINIQNYTRTQLWMDLNTKIAKWMDQ